VRAPSEGHTREDAINLKGHTREDAMNLLEYALNLLEYAQAPTRTTPGKKGKRERGERERRVRERGERERRKRDETTHLERLAPDGADEAHRVRDLQLLCLCVYTYAKHIRHTYQAFIASMHTRHTYRALPYKALTYKALGHADRYLTPRTQVMQAKSTHLLFKVVTHVSVAHKHGNGIAVRLQ
jgi:hypothetical protein